MAVPPRSARPPWPWLALAAAGIALLVFAFWRPATHDPPSAGGRELQRDTRQGKTRSPESAGPPERRSGPPRPSSRWARATGRAGAARAPAAALPEPAAPVERTTWTILLRDASTREPLRRQTVSILLLDPSASPLTTHRTDEEGRLRLAAEPTTRVAQLRHPRYRTTNIALPPPSGEGSAGDREPALEAWLEPGLEIAGEVRDAADRPIAGAEVFLRPSTREGTGLRLRRSGRDGRFRFSGLASVPYRLLARREGYSSYGPRDVAPPAPGGPPVELRITISRDLPVPLPVVDPAGAPLPGVVVRIAPSTGVWPGAAAAGVASDERGIAELRGLPAEPRARLRLSASRDDRPPVAVETTSGELRRGDVRLVLAEGSEARGTVLDEAGAPVPSAVVRLEGPVRKKLRATSRGEFLFRNLPPGRYTLSASALERGGSGEVTLDLPLAAGAAPLVLRAVRGPGVLAGRVVAADGRAAELARVDLFGPGVELATASDARGRFRFTALPEGEYRLGATSARAGRSRPAVARTSREDLVLELETPGEIRGFVVLAGPSVPFAIELREGVDRDETSAPLRTYHSSSSAPRFHLRDVPPGSYRVSLLVAGEREAGDLEVEVRAGETAGPVILDPDGWSRAPTEAAR